MIFLFKQEIVLLPLDRLKYVSVHVHMKKMLLNTFLCTYLRASSWHPLKRVVTMTARHRVEGIPSHVIVARTPDSIPVSIQFYENRNPSIHHTGRILDVERVYVSTANPTRDLSLVASDPGIYVNMNNNMANVKDVTLSDINLHVRYEPVVTFTEHPNVMLTMITFQLMTLESNQEKSEALILAKEKRPPRLIPKEYLSDIFTLAKMR